MSVGSSSFSHSIPILYGNSVGNYIKQFFRLIGRNIILVKYFFSVSYNANIYIRHFFQYYCYIVRTRLNCKTLFSTRPINLVVEEISQNNPVFQTPITYFINQREKYVSIRHDWYLHWYNLHGLSWSEVNVKTTLTAIGHFFANKLRFCPSDIILNSIVLR